MTALQFMKYCSPLYRDTIVNCVVSWLWFPPRINIWSRPENDRKDSDKILTFKINLWLFDHLFSGSQTWSANQPTIHWLLSEVKKKKKVFFYQSVKSWMIKKYQTFSGSSFSNGMIFHCLLLDDCTLKTVWVKDRCLAKKQEVRRFHSRGW